MEFICCKGNQKKIITNVQTTSLLTNTCLQGVKKILQQYNIILNIHNKNESYIKQGALPS